MEDAAIGRMGDAYVLLEVKAQASDAVAQSLLELDPSVVLCAAAVWGPWDVVARVKTESFKQLLDFINRIRTADDRISRTETWWIRHDQEQWSHPGLPDRLAFLMLRVSPQIGSVEKALEYVSKHMDSNDGAQVWHVAGVLGSYDIATMIGYTSDTALTNLVMNRLQGRFGITDTLTIPTIAGMIYPQKRETPKPRVIPDFGDTFADKFPSAAKEISAAGTCYTQSQPMPCVFHLMRAAEVGVRAVAKSLGIPDPVKDSDRNWGKILAQIKIEIDRRSRETPSLWAHTNDKSFFGEVFVSLDAVRSAWRNPTMHVDKIYSDEDAEEIFRFVRAFMRRLESRMDEEGEPKA